VAPRGRAALTGPGAPPDPLRNVREGYDRWARVYDHDANPLIALEDPAVRSAVGDVRGLAVLDLGCGTGRHAVWLAEAGARVTAVDFSRGMLAEARRKPGAERVRFLVGDLRVPLPFADNAFQLVLSGLVLEHVPDLGHFFGEARRLARPGGRAVVSAMHPAMFERDAQARFTDPESGEIVRPGSVPHQVADFVAAAQGAGFAVESVAESAADAAFAVRYPRAARYVGWPMLVVMQLRSPDGAGTAARG
jgi:ubiquinone/menaquinone biosynthesis C-methylase UbiE